MLDFAGTRAGARRVALLAAALVAGAQASAQSAARDWIEAGFVEADVRQIAPADLAPGAGVAVDRSLPVSFIRLAGSNWTHERVLRHVRRTAGIFGVCGIGLGPAQIIEVKAPDGVHDLDMTAAPGAPAPRVVLDLAEMVPRAAHRPPVFFVGQLENDEALARSFRRGETPHEEALRFSFLDTSWIAYKTHWMERSDDQYSTVAHELAHLLCECGHQKSKEKHLMNRYRNFLSGDILPETCAAMRRSPLLVTPDARQATPR